MPGPPPRCGFCGKGPFPSPSGLIQHIQQAVACRNASHREFGQYRNNIWYPLPAEKTPHELAHPLEDPNDETLDNDLNHAAADFPFNEVNDEAPEFPPDRPSATPSRRATVEEVVDEGDVYPGTRFVEPCLAEWKAGAVWGHGVPAFEKIREEQGGHNWGPFEDQDEWELAQWLICNAGQKQTDAFLKMPIVCRSTLLCKTLLKKNPLRLKSEPTHPSEITASSSNELMPSQRRPLNGHAISSLRKETGSMTMGNQCQLRS